MTDLLAGTSDSGSEAISEGDASSMTVAAAEEPALGGELAASSSLEDIVAWPQGMCLPQQPPEQEKTIEEQWW